MRNPAMAYGQIAAGTRTNPIPIKTRKAPIRSIVTSVLFRQHPLTHLWFPEYGKQSRTEKSEPKPDKEAGTHVIYKHAHAESDKDTGRDDESVRFVLFAGFLQPALHFYPLCICDFSTTVCFHALFLMESLIKKWQAIVL